MRRVAIVYDRVNKWGGAERLLLVLHKMFPDADLFTSVYHPKKAEWAHVFPKVIPSFLNKIAILRDRHEYLSLLMPLVFESFNFDEYDLVISVTSEFAKAVVTKPGTQHICICLTPTRYLWSGHGDYFQNRLIRRLCGPIVRYLRSYDLVCSWRPDEMIAISTDVQDRIKKYYGRKSTVLYPPLTQFPKTTIKAHHKFGKYYLLVSRLVGYKKVDLAIRAFNTLGYKLVVVGSGNQEPKLKRMAKGNIVFVGNLTDDELVMYYQNTLGLIFPQIEDFGLVAIEALANGAAVVGYNCGGIRDIIEDGKTGVLFDKQTVESLTSAVKKFEGIKFDPGTLINRSRDFSEGEFRKKLLKIINGRS